jgi:TonB family protein
MIATWMLYSALISALVGIAALAFERVAGARQLPMRFVWLASMIVSVAWTIANGIRRLMPDLGAPVRLMPFTISLEPTRVIARRPFDADWAMLVDRGLLALWIGLSVLLIIRLVQGVIMLRRTRANWRAATVDGMNVRLSSNIGPAVVGLRSMDVVLPEWIMTLDASLRALVLRHEEEHRTARDPYLLLGAAVAVAIMPWNVALWFQARRLRLAIEMDCDARVLRVHPTPERYGLLMLTIAQRRSISPPMFAPMLSEPTSQLERRIIAMRSTTRRVARVTIIAGTAIAVSVLLFACALQSDNNPVSPKPRSGSRSALGRPTPVGDNQTYFEFQVEQAVTVAPGNPQPKYPAELRAASIEGEVLAQFVADTLGTADMSTFKVLKSSHDLFTEAVRATLPGMRFVPAEVGRKKVKQLVQMPFQFNLSHETGSAGAVHIPSPPVKRLEATVPPATEHVKGEYFEFQVTRAATPKAENPQPRYPDALRAANIEGEVVAQFVVDEEGHAMPSTLKVLRSTDPQFTDAVRNVLPQMRFNAARVDGRNVRQLIQMPFPFTLSK